MRAVPNPAVLNSRFWRSQALLAPRLAREAVGSLKGGPEDAIAAVGEAVSAPVSRITDEELEARRSVVVRPLLAPHMPEGFQGHPAVLLRELFKSYPTLASTFTVCVSVRVYVCARVRA